MTKQQKAEAAYAAYIVAYARYIDAKANAAAAEEKSDAAYRALQRSEKRKTL